MSRLGSRRRRQAAVVLAVTAVAATSAACGGGSESSSDGSTKVAAVIKGLDNPFFQSMEKGIQAQADDAGISATVQAAQNITDTTGQADKLTALTSKDYSCYIVNPITGTNLVQGVAQLAAQDKPVVNIDRPMDSKALESADAKVDTYVGTDNVSAGEKAGQQMTKLLGQGGDVALITGVSGDVTSNDRMKGFKQGISSDINVVQSVSGKWKRGEALTKASTVLRSHPDLKGFFVANDDMALGVARAAANAGKADQVHIVSVDGIEDGLKAVKSGDLDATVAQYPYAIGLMGVEACQAASSGKDLPQDVEAPVEVVTKQNVDKALQTFPEPFAPYDDPYKDLLK